MGLESAPLNFIKDIGSSEELESNTVSAKIHTHSEKLISLFLLYKVMKTIDDNLWSMRMPWYLAYLKVYLFNTSSFSKLKDIILVKVSYVSSFLLKGFEIKNVVDVKII